MDEESKEPRRKNGQQIGAEYTDTLARYFNRLREEGRGLPARNGKVSISAVAQASGVDKQSLYKNSHCRALLEQAAINLGLSGIGQRRGELPQDSWKDERILNLEQKVASLQAEVEGLRHQVNRYAHIEQHLVETGRRVVL